MRPGFCPRGLGKGEGVAVVRLIHYIKSLVEWLTTRPAPESPAIYKAGQVWMYKTRDGEEDSRLYIVKVDGIGTRELCDVYHICADGLKIENPLCPSGVQTDLPYAPVSKETLDKSVTRLATETRELPDISEQYADWRATLESEGGGGFFTIAVDEIVSLIESVTKRK